MINANQGLIIFITLGVRRKPKTEDGRPKTEDGRPKHHPYPRRGLTLVARDKKGTTNFGGARNANIQGGGMVMRRMMYGDQGRTIINYQWLN